MGLNVRLGTNALAQQGYLAGTDQESARDLEKAFLDPEIRAIVILLFLSMLPLHSENRQRQDALLANVFRLFVDLERD